MKCFRVGFFLFVFLARGRKQLISRQQSHFPITHSGLCAKPPFHAYNKEMAWYLCGTGSKGMEEVSRNVWTGQSYTNNNPIWKRSFPSLPWATWPLDLLCPTWEPQATHGHWALGVWPAQTEMCYERKWYIGFSEIWYKKKSISLIVFFMLLIY